MENIAHLKVGDKIPCYHSGTKKACRRKIQELMRNFGYDDDVVDSINDDFCEGFGIARDIIIEMLKDDYYAKTKT